MAAGCRSAFSLLTALALAGVACSGPTGVRSLESSGPATSSTTVAPPERDPGPDDPMFPRLGNAGIDVEHYDLYLDYDRTTATLEASVALDVVLTDERDQIRLDAVGLDVEQVTVDDQGVDVEVGPDKLTIPLPAGTADDDRVRVVVDYSVVPSPSESAVGLPVGWFATAGGSYTTNEPDGARTWMPCNDHPSDKATYDITISVPSGTTGIANGDLVSHTTSGGVDVWHWRDAAPMATYLLLVVTGDYELVEAQGPHGLPLTSAVLRGDRSVMRPFLDSIDDQIAWFEQWFGPYPFDRYGIAMTDSPGGLAMETQGRSLFSRDDFGSGVLYETTEMLLSHELVHQWFGDAVTPSRWSDIWLNEAFATYGEWMWLDHVGLQQLGTRAEGTLLERPFGSSADPVVTDLFGYNSYAGGAVVLHALRLTVGDDVFFDILRRWAQDNVGTSRTTADFIATAEAVSGRSLTDFFDAWLFAELLPSSYPSRAGV